MKHLFYFSLILLLSTGFQFLSAQGLVLYGIQNDNPQNPMNGDFEVALLNPTSGQSQALYTIPNTAGAAVGSSTFDHAQNRFIFMGVDDFGAYRFYSASIDSAEFLSPSVGSNRIPNGLQYDLQSQEIFGLIWDDAADTEYLVKVDPTTGVLTDSVPLPGMKALDPSSICYNSNHHRYYVIGTTFNDYRLYVIDTKQGQIVHQPIIDPNNRPYAIQYDLTLNRLVGLYREVDSTLSNGITNYNRLYFSEVDTLTGNSTMMGNTPILKGFFTGVAVGFTDYDQTSQTYVMVGQDDATSRSLFLIDGVTGNVAQTTPLSNLVYELECDNQVFARTAYANNTPTNIATSDNIAFEIFPNPASSNINLKIDVKYQIEQVELIDMRGKLLGTFKQDFAGNTMNLQVPKLETGIYMVRVTTSTGNWAMKKIIIE